MEWNKSELKLEVGMERSHNDWNTVELWWKYGGNKVEIMSEKMDGAVDYYDV